MEVEPNLSFLMAAIQQSRRQGVGESKSDKIRCTFLLPVWETVPRMRDFLERIEKLHGDLTITKAKERRLPSRRITGSFGDWEVAAP